MLSSLKNIFKVTDLRNKILFTLFIILLYRLGSNITVPGIDFNAVQDLQRQAQSGGVLGFLNLFSGGALTQMAVFALGIMPYITSSIIMQLLAVVIPKIEQWQKQGAVGQKKITQWTRYMTVGLAVLQAGERDRALYLITEGTLAVRLPHAESAFKTIEAPAVVGELAFFDGEPRSATLDALTDVEGARLDAGGFDRLSAVEPELARAMLLDLARILAGRLRRASELIADLRE